jgi:hypothetical protein
MFYPSSLYPGNAHSFDGLIRISISFLNGAKCLKGTKLFYFVYYLSRESTRLSTSLADAKNAEPCAPT